MGGWDGARYGLENLERPLGPSFILGLWFPSPDGCDTYAVRQSIEIYFATATIRSLGPGSLIRDMSANPAFFIQLEYSFSL